MTRGGHSDERLRDAPDEPARPRPAGAGGGAGPRPAEAERAPEDAAPAGAGPSTDGDREAAVTPPEVKDGEPDAEAGEPDPSAGESDADAGEPDPEAGAREEAPGGPAELLARAEAERDEYLALAQRSQADFDNYRKRAAREIASAGARGKAELVREMLPVVDNLERALGSADDADNGLAEGVRLVHGELVAALERNGVEPIEPTGEPFDPSLHEALSTRPEDGSEPGVVLDVVQKGYRLDQTVLRPARVVVSA